MNDLNRVLYECRDHVGVITLNRPEVLNAFDRDMYDGVNRALQLFRDDSTAYVGVLQAAGDRAFSAGADVKAIAADIKACLLYTSPSPRDGLLSRMPSSA